MLFHEIYGTYYNTVSKLLTLAVNGELTNEKLHSIVKDNAFLESSHTIIPKLKTQEWQLLNKDNTTPLKHIPSLPLTTLQKKWLKAICLDPRIQLFNVDITELEEINPLFTL